MVVPDQTLATRFTVILLDSTNPIFLHSVHKTTPLDHTFSQYNSVHTFTLHSFNIQLNPVILINTYIHLKCLYLNKMWNSFLV